MNTYSFYNQDSFLIAKANESHNGLLSMSFFEPSISLIDTNIIISDFGLVKLQLVLNQINDIDGSEPSSLEDAYEKLLNIIN